ncbi:MAG TPA: WbqC family protein [Bacteroidales bacterium]|nr:WbqC family protein [Bacteroidales bacterium]
MILTTSYLPPVQYISKFVSGSPLIEIHENYQKQSYRNRCCIYGANGVQSLVIPVKKTHFQKMPIGEVEIDYATNWQRVHCKAIESAYRLSPFYEYYADELETVIQQPTVRLIELNTQLLKLLFSWIGLTTPVKFTEDWTPVTDPDYRKIIQPKSDLRDESFHPVPYQQAFSERYGFRPNLSIIDLLFNEGPETLSILQKCFPAKSR